MIQTSFFRLLRGLLLGCSLLLSGPHADAQPAKPGRKAPVPAAGTDNFLFLSDVHLNGTTDTTCLKLDAGTAVWASCKKKLESIITGPTPPKFILYTGDLPFHQMAMDTYAQAKKDAIRTVLRDLGALAKKGKVPIPVLYAPGNNDAIAGDYYPFSGAAYPTPFSLVNTDSTDAYFPYSLFNIHKSSTPTGPYMISGENAASGYWSVQLAGLRVICLNTVLWGTAIAWNVPDSSLNAMVRAEMKWLQQQVEYARASGSKVFLAMHIPPGMNAYDGSNMWNSWPDYSIQDTFLKLVQRHASTITGIFYGHTHYDELRLLYDSTGTKQTAVAFSCPGVSAQHKNYPAFKVVRFDSKTKIPMDFTTHYFNLKNCNTTVVPWGNDQYTFNQRFQGKPTQSIAATLNYWASKNFQHIKDGMATTYLSGNGTDSGGSLGIRTTWQP